MVIGRGDGLSYGGEGGRGFVLPYFVDKGASWRVEFRMVGCLLSLVSWWRRCGGVSVVVVEEEDRNIRLQGVPYVFWNRMDESTRRRLV